MAGTALGTPAIRARLLATWGCLRRAAPAPALDAPPPHAEYVQAQPTARAAELASPEELAAPEAELSAELSAAKRTLLGLRRSAPRRGQLLSLALLILLWRLLLRPVLLQLVQASAPLLLLPALLPALLLVLLLLVLLLVQLLLLVLLLALLPLAPPAAPPAAAAPALLAWAAMASRGVDGGLHSGTRPSSGQRP